MLDKPYRRTVLIKLSGYLICIVNVSDLKIVLILTTSLVLIFLCVVVKPFSIIMDSVMVEKFIN